MNFIALGLSLVFVVVPLRPLEIQGNVPQHHAPGRIVIKGNTVWVSDGTHVWHSDTSTLRWMKLDLPSPDSDVEFGVSDSLDVWVRTGPNLSIFSELTKQWRRLPLPQEFEIVGLGMSNGNTPLLFGGQNILTDNLKLNNENKYTTRRRKGGRTEVTRPSFGMITDSDRIVTLPVMNSEGLARDIVFTRRGFVFSTDSQVFYCQITVAVLKCRGLVRQIRQDNAPTALSNSISEVWWVGDQTGGIERCDLRKGCRSQGRLDQTDGIEKLIFLTLNKGFALSAGSLFRSIDSGKTWKRIPISDVEDIANDGARLLILTPNQLMIREDL